MSVEQIVEEIKTLSPEEQKRLRAAINGVTTPPAATDTNSAELDVQRRLLEAGVITEIRHRTRDQQSFQSYKPITIRGKPLSETIIEERR